MCRRRIHRARGTMKAHERLGAGGGSGSRAGGRQADRGGVVQDQAPCRLTPSSDLAALDYIEPGLLAHSRRRGSDPPALGAVSCRRVTDPDKVRRRDPALRHGPWTRHRITIESLSVADLDIADPHATAAPSTAARYGATEPRVLAAETSAVGAPASQLPASPVISPTAASGGTAVTIPAFALRQLVLLRGLGSFGRGLRVGDALCIGGRKTHQRRPDGGNHPEAYGMRQESPSGQIGQIAHSC